MNEKLDSPDLKSIFLTVVFVSVGVYVCFYFTNIRERHRQDDIHEFRGQTSGTVVSIEPIERMDQSRWKGTEISIDSYKLVYRYKVNEIEFQKTNFIPNTPNNQKFIRKLQDKDKPNVFVVLYDKKAPAKSVLVENE